MYKSSETSGVKNILLVAITRLGDMLQASPMIVGLKKQNPDARITVLIDKSFATICSGIPGIDEVFVLDLDFMVRSIHRGEDGLVAAYKYMEDAVTDLKDRDFDYCINMSNSAYTALLIKMLEVKENRGWLSDEEGYRIMADPWAMLFAAFVYHSNRDYNELNLVDIFRCAAGVYQHPRSLCYKASEEAHVFAEEFLKEHGMGGERPLVCLQAGASQGKRQWGAERFARLTRLLVEELGADVVFTGSRGEQSMIAEIMSLYSSEHVVSSAGRTSFAELAAILARANTLVTGDTGPMHLSVAVGTPVVAMFLASALCFETGPYGPGNFVLQPQINCNPCNPNYPCSRPDCHEQISPELVAYVTALRLNTPLGGEQGVEISPSVADPSQVIVYRTDFDQDGFLKFHSINGIAPRHGEPDWFAPVARSAYMSLWKEEFAGVECLEVPRVETGAWTTKEVHWSFKGGSKIVALALAGRETISQLIKLIRDVHSPASLLSGVDARLQLIDRELETACLAYPLFGCIVRVFIMEKENLRGDDALKLAKETDELYLTLQRRCERLNQLFVAFMEQRQLETPEDKSVKLKVLQGVR